MSDTPPLPPNATYTLFFRNPHSNYTLGPAAADGRLRVGDQLTEINGQSTRNMTHAEAIETIKNGGATVRLLVKRGKVPPPAMLGRKILCYRVSKKRTTVLSLLVTAQQHFFN